MTSESKLMRIAPVETNREHKDQSGEKRVVQRIWQPDKHGRFFPATLTVEQMKPALVQSRVKIENVQLKKEEEFIIYQYVGRPQIRLNLKDGHFYATALEIQVHSKEAAQQQAHVVLEKLKKSNLSSAIIGKPVLGSSARQLLGQLKTYKQDY